MRIHLKEDGKILANNPWFYIPKPNPKATFRLFCFPYAGGMAELYYPWIEELPNNIEMIAIQYPGHIMGGQDKLYVRLSNLIEDLYKEINCLLDLDYAFFGHSMGALVSYELARHINKKGVKAPRQLFLSARTPPHLPGVTPQTYQMTDTEYVQYLQVFNILPESILKNQRLLQTILPILRADFEIVETWKYDPNTPQLELPICAFAGTNDSFALPCDMEKWNNYTSMDFKMFTFPEKHYFILNKEVRHILIQKLKEVLI